ncbi:Hypothetical predicted protein [Mytilus galloprovincialis]|uniref:SCAN box domain-containing protein n=1 Tax=Mytilus galloprovincialis TaxID=29158 RepID=A0A8B6HEC7_MYTGA|nr:Hypothetical predicted protein [Mytilus galloprovincialis]
MEKKEKEDEFKLKELEMKEREKLKELEMRERLEMEKLKIELVKEESNTKVHSKSDYFDAAKTYVWPLKSEKSSDYDTVKREVLKAYELVPEAYRQKFRSYKKFDSQTYVEFAREKEDLFDKWLTSKKTDNNFDNLRQLILLEEFKLCVHLDLKTHLDDKTVESIHDAAVISDNYTLSHKRSFKGQNVNTSSGNYKNQSNERTDSKSVAQNKSQSSYNMSSPKFDTFEKKSLTCAYCKKIGHLMADCFRLQKKNERDNKPKTSACTTPYNTSTLECPASQAFKSSFCDYMEEYKPFMSDGFVSIVDDTTLQPIKILRDTGASQTLLLEEGRIQGNRIFSHGGHLEIGESCVKYR